MPQSASEVAPAEGPAASKSLVKQSRLLDSQRSAFQQRIAAAAASASNGAGKHEREEPNGAKKPAIITAIAEGPDAAAKEYPAEMFYTANPYLEQDANSSEPPKGYPSETTTHREVRSLHSSGVNAVLSCL